LEQTILRERGFKIVQMKGNIISQGEIIAKEKKYIIEIFKKSSPEPAGEFHKFQSNLV
jgi:CRISPR/Cas system-associated exonuclease Cas4 (RecB family)